jgi:hypothetical protein
LSIYHYFPLISFSLQALQLLLCIMAMVKVYSLSKTCYFCFVLSIWKFKSEISTFQEFQFEPHVRIRKWFFRISFWVLAIFLLIALVRKSDWGSTFSSLQRHFVELIILLTLVWSLSFLFRAFRFQSEWKNQGKISIFSAMRLTVLHNAAVVLVPFRVGELGYPVLSSGNS